MADGNCFCKAIHSMPGLIPRKQGSPVQLSNPTTCSGLGVWSNLPTPIAAAQSVIRSSERAKARTANQVNRKTVVGRRIGDPDGGGIIKKKNVGRLEAGPL